MIYGVNIFRFYLCDFTQHHFEKKKYLISEERCYDSKIKNNFLMRNYFFRIVWLTRLFFTHHRNLCETPSICIFPTLTLSEFFSTNEQTKLSVVSLFHIFAWLNGFSAKNVVTSPRFNGKKKSTFFVHFFG